MVRVDTHTVTFQVEGVLTELGVTQLILVEIGPSPYLSINDMRKPLPAGHLGRRKRERGGGRE